MDKYLQIGKFWIYMGKGNGTIGANKQ